MEGLMSQQDLVKQIHAFTFSGLGYCNGVFVGLSQKRKRVKDQAAAAESKSCEELTQIKTVLHTSQFLRSLCWPPVFSKNWF